jgi:hypothetical protein
MYYASKPQTGADKATKKGGPDRNYTVALQSQSEWLNFVFTSKQKQKTVYPKEEACNSRRW